MNQPGGVGGAKSPGDFPADAQHLGDGELPLPVETAVEGFAFEEGHDDEGSASVLADVEDRHDVIVLQGSGGFGLTEKALLQGLASGQVGQHGFDGHLAAQLGVFSLENDTHASVPEDPENAITAEPAQFVIGLAWRQETDQAGIVLGWGVGRPGGIRQGRRRPG